MPPSPTAWLEFPSGDRFWLSDGATTMGRAPGNRLLLTTERVSRNHAAIRQESDGTFLLVDLGSSNGTFLNGQRVTRPVTLRNGCNIEIGLQRMIFRTVPDGSTPGEPAGLTDAICWLLALSAAELGCRTPGEEMIDKTYESWTERAQRVVAKHRGRAMRARDEGLLAFWPVDSADPRAANIAAALRSLRIAPRPTEALRLSLHYGPVKMK